ncbi:hypothetical protein HPB47_001842 [Ixodes persulcatus]|uniref:Uncharacterized protein n=1 Tax=Ixodes persulcatus TaxID=34615 RepID=A0AC60PN42_IXOPE|nr:hypothetical protein HPB47_001842 [Ixodes persulcatus]
MLETSFLEKVSPTDYHRFIYKCHTCLLGFKRRGMLVNHLAKRHPDVRPDSVPELNLPILRATRDYYCQYCEKVYRSSSKRKAHIIKNHPGAALPMSNRIKGGVPSVPGEPNPTFSHMVGSVTTQPHNCCLCHKQYASKAKLLQHQRKKHMDMIALTLVSSAQANGNSRRREADLLTRAMSELTQTLTDFRQGSNPASFLSGGPLEQDPEEAVGDQVVSDALDSSVDNDEVAGATLDQAQINQLLAQYQQQAALSRKWQPRELRRKDYVTSLGSKLQHNARYYQQREGEEASSERAHGNLHGTPNDLTRRGTRCDPENWDRRGVQSSPGLTLALGLRGTIVVRGVGSPAPFTSLVLFSAAAFQASDVLFFGKGI